MAAIGNTVSTRNRAIDQGRLLASLMVIFLHAPIPGFLGDIVSTASRMAVPFFFMVSGYYACGKASADLRKRAMQTFKLFCLSVLLYFAWDLLLGVSRGYAPAMLQKWISLETLFETFILQTGAIKHLWFLLTLFYCYFIYAYMFRRASVKAKMFVSIPLLLACFAVAQISRKNGLEDVSYYCRNVLFVGLPFFLLGSIVRQEQNKLFSIRAPFLWCTVVSGFLLAETERILVGTTDLYIGTVVYSFAMFILHASDKMPASDLLSKLGRKYSRDIYILHMLVLAMINIATSVFSAVFSIPNLLHNSVFITIVPFAVFGACLLLVAVKEKNGNSLL